MFLKNILLALATFSLQYLKEHPQASPLAIVTNHLRSQILTIVFKTLFGIILASLVIYSIIQAGQAFQIWISQFENRVVFELTSFSFIALAGTAVLYFLFQNNGHRFSRQTKANPDHIDLHVLAIKFTEGFLSQLENPKTVDPGIIQRDANEVQKETSIASVAKAPKPVA
ncbi:MAG: hypothetical protein BroJett040_05090 [Oligoflexia bacterium]|nr:MAG: hypothetical protein BroJett040_05090 [Oligoflexia bacterium]